MQHLKVILLAAGNATRCSSHHSVPKQFLNVHGELEGLNLIDRNLQLFLDCCVDCHIVLLLPPQHPLADSWFIDWQNRLGAKNIVLTTCEGGASRSESVFLGLRTSRDFSPANQDEWVLVHDVARPYLTVAEMNIFYAAVIASNLVGGIVAKPVTDTLKSLNETVTTLARERIWCAQTPQLFKLDLLYRAYEQVIDEKIQITDDAQAMELQGHHYLLHKVNCKNDKITFMEDFQTTLPHQAIDHL